MGIKSLVRHNLVSDGMSALDRIDFNTTKSVKSPAAFITKITRGDTEAVGDNQAVGQDLGDKQALGEAENKLILEGFVSKRNHAGGNPILIIMDLWMNEPKQIDNWPEGRLGWEDADEPVKDVIPVNTGSNQVGLILESIVYTSDLGKNQERFVMTLTVSRGDGT